MAVVENLKQIAALFGCEVGEPPVIENEEFDPRDSLEQPGVSAVAACERQRIEQAEFITPPLIRWPFIGSSDFILPLPDNAAHNVNDGRFPIRLGQIAASR
jgi:hypothetical protein